MSLTTIWRKTCRKKKNSSVVIDVLKKRNIIRKTSAGYVHNINNVNLLTLWRAIYKWIIANTTKVLKMTTICEGRLHWVLVFIGEKRGNWGPSLCSAKMYKFWQVIKRAEVSAVRVTGRAWLIAGSHHNTLPKTCWLLSSFKYLHKRTKFFKVGLLKINVPKRGFCIVFGTILGSPRNLSVNISYENTIFPKCEGK